jgi:opacity protein-like surface antigen
VSALFAIPLALGVLTALPRSPLHAQSVASPIGRALYLALGGDPGSGGDGRSTPFSLSAGIEQSRTGSRWAFRLGADYRQQTSNSLGSSRSEDFRVGLSARYGRASGAIRPYALAGVGGAQLRIRVRDARYYADPNGTLLPPQSYDLSRWAGSLTTGFGTDINVGRLRLFSEARMTSYMNVFHPSTGAETRKTLLFGIKF